MLVIESGYFVKKDLITTVSEGEEANFTRSQQVR